jgi:uncharacterized protein YndB with AHSA1/START domain
MAESRFVYITYIRAPAEKIWEALTSPETNKAFWGGYFQQSSWAVGDAYRIRDSEGEVWDEGKVIAVEPPHRLQVTWLHLKDAEMKAEGESLVTFPLEPYGSDGVTRLTVTHEIGVEGSKLIAAISFGWPHLLSSLKSLLETGRALS